MTVTSSQTARAYAKGAKRAAFERDLNMRDEPSDDVWETVSPLDVYGWVTGEKNPSDYDLDVIRDVYEDGYYETWEGVA